MLEMKLFHVLLLFTTVTNECFGQNFTKLFHWPQVDYAFPEKTTAEDQPMNKTLYKPWKNIIQGTYLWKNKLFLSVFSLQNTPNETLFALTYVNFNTTEKSPLLIPYPPDQVHRIRSATTIDVDICDRLWLTDHISKKLFVIDLLQNKIQREVQINVTRISSFVSITVDVANASDCNSAYAYIPDMSDFRILVFRYNDSKYWYVDRPVYFIGENVQVQRINIFHGYRVSSWGIYSTALSEPNTTTGHKVLFLQPTSSEDLLSVSTYTLQNADFSFGYNKFYMLGNWGKDRVANIIHYDKTNFILFYALLEQNALGCWNVKRYPNDLSKNTTHLINPDNVTLVGVQGLQTVGNNLLITTRNWRLENQDEKYSFSIYSVNIAELVKNTVCELVV